MSVPFDKSEVEEYEQKRYRGVDQRIVHTKEERILRKILRNIGNGTPWVLDIPCGYGRFSSLLFEKGLRLVSCDLSFHMVNRARERSKVPANTLGVVADGVLGLPFKGGVFNLVVSMRFFHHLHKREERRAVLDEFSWITKGWVVLSYYQMNFLHLLQRKLRRRIKSSRTRIKMISRREFEEEIKESGFKVLRVFPLFRGIHSHHIALLKKA
ncbi:MAG: class I SAM-dependent methyltransferase [Candidatus Aminicenantaceae bacterium]